MRWAWPWQAALAGLAAAALLALAAWWSGRHRREALRRWLGPDAARLVRCSPGRRAVRLALFLAGLVLLVAGLGRPQGAAVRRPGDLRHAVLLVLDLSASMQAQDATPSRLGLARRWAEALAGQLPAARLGLIGFAGEPCILCPPTEDHGLFLELLRSLPEDLALRQGSELGPALGLARRTLELAGGGDILLLTDGEHHDADPAAALAGARGLGLVAVTVGGTVPVPIPAPAGGEPIRDPRDGFPARTAARPEAMAALAGTTAGLAVSASHPGDGLAEALHWLRRHAAWRPGLGDAAERRELGPWLLAAALGLLLAHMALGERPAGPPGATASPQTCRGGTPGRAISTPANPPKAARPALSILAALAVALLCGGGRPGDAGETAPGPAAAELARLREISLQVPGHDRPRCLYNLALAAHHAGRVEEARQAYLQALALPGCPRVVRARCLNNLGAMDLEQARNAGATPARARVLVGQARAALCEAARLEPGLAAAGRNLAELEALAAMLPEAPDLAEAALPDRGSAPPPAPPSPPLPPRTAAERTTAGRDTPRTPAGRPDPEETRLQALCADAGSAADFLRLLYIRSGTALPPNGLPW